MKGGGEPEEDKDSVVRGKIWCEDLRIDTGEEGILVIVGGRVEVVAAKVI